MKIANYWRAFRSRLPWMVSMAASVVVGIALGWFLLYAKEVDHPISNAPIPVDFCFWISHPDLFRGQPVQTEARYMQPVEAGIIYNDECVDLDVGYYWPHTTDPVREEWEKDLFSNFYAAQFDLEFVGTIPAYPRYVHWRNDASNHWRPVHIATTFRVDRLIRYRRIR